MTWNHRVLRHKNKRRVYYAVHEVFYNERGKPWLWTQGPIEVVGETVADIREELTMIQRALATPILEIHNKKLRRAR